MIFINKNIYDMKNCYLNETLNDLNNFKKIIKEAYDMPQGDMQQQDPQQNAEMGQQGIMDGGQEQLDPQLYDIIDKIRQLAIQGIAQFADQVESEGYQNLKKIWLMTDKIYEESFGDKNKK